MVRRLGLVVALAAVMCLVGSSLHAQTVTASVSGNVKDAQGGVLPGATVTLTSETKGTVTTVTTDSLGNFLFPYVVPDTYTLKMALENFQTAVRKSLVVNASDRIAIPAVTLVIGQMSETVTVTGESQDIQLKSGERAFTLQSTQISNLAVNGRSFFGLAVMVPGVVPSSDTPTQVSNFNVNGQRANSNNMVIDGVANIDTGDNGGNMAQTNLDAVSEFKVLTASYQAEYGRAVGGQVQVVTKSGSRDFRGSGYWYGRRSNWNENTWWNIRDNTAKANSARNDQGYTFGGPIFIPGLFNSEKNKLFFFWNQEFQRRRDPVGEQRVTVPTALERAGDFSQSVDNNGNKVYIKDPLKSGTCSASDTTACFSYQGVLNKIDPSRLYAPTQAALSIFPQPNVAGQKGYNYKSQTPAQQPLNQNLFRADYQLSDNYRVTGRWMNHSNKSTLPYGISGWSLGGNLDTLQVTSDTPAYNWLGTMTGVLSNTTSLEISIGSAHNSLDHYSSASLLTRAGSGMTNLPLLYPGAVQNDFIPSFGWGGNQYQIGSAPTIRTNQAPFTNFNTTYDIVANLTKVMGAHNVKTGFYFQRSLKDQSAFANFNGNYDFAANSSNPLSTGFAFANAAIGVMNSFNQANIFAKPKWRYSNAEFYAQDNFKPKDNLTLDYGVRFYFMTPQWDASQLASNWLASAYDPAKAVRLYQPTVINGALVGYDAVTKTSVASSLIGRVVPNSGDRFDGAFVSGQGISTTLTDGNKFKVSPRLGFAYDIKGEQKYVVRGAFGIFYDRPQGNAVFDLINNPPTTQATTLSYGYVKDLASATAPLPAPIGLQPNVYNWKVPTVYQWNLGVQIRLPAQTTLDVSYVGSESRNLLQFRNLNANPYGQAYTAAAQDPTRGAGCTGCPTTSTIPGGNALAQNLLRPYIGYTDIRLWEFAAHSDYKALQTSVSHRMSKGLMVSGYYTYSAAKGTLGGDWDYARIDGNNEQANYGPLSFNRPHVFVMNFVYQTPDVAKGALAYATNGWQVSGNFRYLYGTPYSPGFSIPNYGNVNLTGSYTEGARIALTGQPISTGYNTSDPYHQFNIDAFTAPSINSLGLESPRYTMYNPPTRVLDLSLAKQFPFGGKRRFEIRLDAFNALNTVNFSGVNSGLNFKSYTDHTVINLPYDAAGNLVTPKGVGTVSGVRAARELQLMCRFSF